MAEKKTKLKMRNGKYIALWIPLLLIFALVIGVVNIAANLAAPTLDTFLGRGAASYQDVHGTTTDAVTYYTANATTADEARENSEAVAERVSDEGQVLLKNDGVLPLAAGSTVTPFGYAYLNPAYSGTGAGAAGSAHNVDPATALGNHFAVNDATAKAMQSGEIVKLVEAEGTAPAYSTGVLTSDSIIYGYEASVYAGTEESCSGTTAIVFLTRQGNEGADKKMDGYADGTAHYLQLSQMEKDTIAFAKANCDSVIVVLVTSNAMEVDVLCEGDYEVNAILWIGNPGARGFESMAKILCGEVNPSGRLVDTWAADFTADPTFQNMGSFQYSNVDVEATGMAQYYLEYQEGIYSGYRYYETAAVEDPTFSYDAAVVFPFGFGLSYTTFDQQVTSFDDSGDDVIMTVSVTNTGSVAGKDVVQAYISSPYTAYDAANGIEKSAVTLAGFAKTKLLEPGESCEVTITFAKEDMASYSFTHANADGTTGCYILESGDYTVSLRANSHDVIDERIVTIAQTVAYEGADGRSSDLVTATNQFQDSDDYMTSSSTIFSRSDWAGTFPVRDEGNTKEASEQVKDAFYFSFHYDVNTDPELGNVEGSKVYTYEMPAERADNGLVLADMRGLAYDDPQWELFLDQIDYEEDGFLQMLYAAGYQTAPVNALGKPAGYDQDGDTALNIMGKDTCAWMSKPVLASTWNVDLMYEVGAAFGQEALTDGLTGWYAPGMNIHRSPFCGRNLEYFSEDPVLTGKLAASLISGAADQGLVCYMKHFAVNDQETNRENFVNVWADEQTMREVYLKPFEIAVKEATMTINYQDESGEMATVTMPAALGIMSAQSNIGTRACYGHYGLMTGVLRNEWGFRGIAITDLIFSMDSTQRDQMVRAGNDNWLMMNVAIILQHNATDLTSATARTAMRNAAHHICYSIANSAAMNGIARGSVKVYATSPWRWLPRIINLVAVVLVALKIRRFVVRGIDQKNNPEKYKPSRKQRKAAKLAAKQAAQA